MKNIYIGNLSHSSSEADLRSLFEAYGQVDKVSVITGRGFAFVEMTNDAEGNAAIQALNGTELGGRTLNINEARPKREGGGGGRGGFGGGRGGFGGGGGRDRGHSGGGGGGGRDRGRDRRF